MIEVSAILQAGVRIINTSGGETIQIPKTTAHSTAAIVTEASAIGVSDPTFGQATLGAYKYGVMVQVSRELVDDTGIDLQGYLAEETGRALGNAIGAHLVAGTGTGQPRGVLTDATLGVTGGTGVTGGFTGDNLIDLYYSVIAPYRNSPAAAWLVKDSTMASLRKIKDTTGQYIFQPSLQANTPETLLGKPVYTDPNVPATAVNKSVLFGDFSRYFVRLAGGVRFERSDEYAFNTDLITYRALLRGDGALMDTSGRHQVLRRRARPDPADTGHRGEIMKVRLVHDISGTRDGKAWPAAGEEVDVSDAEALVMLQNGSARAVAEKPGRRRGATGHRRRGHGRGHQGADDHPGAAGAQQAGARAGQPGCGCR
jgi:hypothetical protein